MAVETRYMEINMETDLFNRLINRSTFAWSQEKTLTFGKYIGQSAYVEAARRLVNIKRDSYLSTIDIVEKVKSRAVTWKREGLLVQLASSFSLDVVDSLARITKQRDLSPCFVYPTSCRSME